MGLALKEQLAQQNPAANPDCEDCWGSGWVVRDVTNRYWLEQAGFPKIVKSAPFVMKCDKCNAYHTHPGARLAAEKAGVTIGKGGHVVALPSAPGKVFDAPYQITGTVRVVAHDETAAKEVVEKMCDEKLLDKSHGFTVVDVIQVGS